MNGFPHKVVVRLALGVASLALQAARADALCTRLGEEVMIIFSLASLPSMTLA